MNLTLHISPELEAKLLQQATAEAKAPEQLAAEVLAERFSASEWESGKLALEVWLAELDSLAFATPPGSLNADFSRDTLYEGRGE